MVVKRDKSPGTGRKADAKAEALRAEAQRKDEFGESLEEVFAEELRECLQLVPPQLEMLRSPTTHAVACDQLQRVFHTIKGSAALVGLDELSRAALVLEGRRAPHLRRRAERLGQLPEQHHRLASRMRMRFPTFSRCSV